MLSDADLANDLGADLLVSTAEREALSGHDAGDDGRRGAGPPARAVRPPRRRSRRAGVAHDVDAEQRPREPQLARMRPSWRPDGAGSRAPGPAREVCGGRAPPARVPDRPRTLGAHDGAASRDAELAVQARGDAVVADRALVDVGHLGGPNARAGRTRRKAAATSPATSGALRGGAGVSSRRSGCRAPPSTARPHLMSRAVPSPPANGSGSTPRRGAPSQRGACRRPWSAFVTGADGPHGESGALAMSGSVAPGCGRIADRSVAVALRAGARSARPGATGWAPRWTRAAQHALVRALGSDTPPMPAIGFTINPSLSGGGSQLAP